MMGPLYMMGELSYAWSMALAVLIGMGFGFCLERSGFGDARVLVDIFYFRDFRVMRVMFSAIVTAMIALIVLSWPGLFDYTVMVNYALLKTWLWPQLIGGIVFGVGFVVGGYCPGTSMVGISSGRLDALVFFVGMFLGVWLFAGGYPWIESFYMSSAMERVTLWELFGISKELMAAIIVVFALVAFYIARKAEQWAPYRKETAEVRPPEARAEVESPIALGQ